MCVCQYLETSLDQKILSWQLVYPALCFPWSAFTVHERHRHLHSLPLRIQILEEKKRRFRCWSQRVKMVLSMPLPLLRPKAQLCYLHSFPLRPFRGFLKVDGRLGGWLWKGKGLWRPPVESLHTTRESGWVSAAPPLPHSLPASIIKCSAAAGVREKDGERSDALLSQLPSSLNKSQ